MKNGKLWIFSDFIILKRGGIF